MFVNVSIYGKWCFPYFLVPKMMVKLYVFVANSEENNTSEHLLVFLKPLENDSKKLRRRVIKEAASLNLDRKDTAYLE